MAEVEGEPIAEMHAGEMTSHGKRGITNLDMLRVNDPGVSLMTSQAAPGDDGDFDFRIVTVWVDSFPKDDRWVPPLHGDDVDSFSDNLMKNLDEQKDNYAEFTRILETNGCPSSSLVEDILPCFKDERELQHPAIRGEACGNDDISSLSKSFFYKFGKGRIIRPSGAELRRCLDVIPENLDDIAWRDEFQSSNDEAVEAAKRLDWETARECYEACLMLMQLEAFKERVSAKIQAWLMLWVCVPLAYLYQFRLSPRNYSRCVLLYDQVLEHLNNMDDANLVDLYYSVIWHRRMVLFQWSYAFEDQSLVAKYMRFRAFSEVQIVEDFDQFSGFILLQRIINFWGRRTRRGLEGDMRVALCTNLEHLHRELKQWSEAELWTNEKWRSICTFSDVLHELNLQWRLSDVASLFDAGRAEKAQRMISALEESAAATSLPEAVLFKIRYWKARILAGSDLIKASDELQKLRNELERKALTENEELLVYVKLEIGELNDQLRDAKILELAPVGVEKGKEWDDDIDRTATDLLKNISPSFEVAVDINSNVELESYKESYTFQRIQGKQLLMSLGKPFMANRIEELRDRVHAAADHFQKCLDLMAKQEKDAVQFRDEVFDHEHEVETRRTSDINKIHCYIHLGYCAMLACRLKPQGDKYDENLQREMHPKAEIALTSLVKANNYLQEALSLAVEKGFDVEVPRIREALGFVHYRRAREFYEWLKHFKDSMPLFRAEFVKENGNEKSEVKLFVRKICGNIYHEHWHSLELSEYQVSCIFFQFPPAPDSGPSSSSSPAPQNPFPPFESLEVVKIKINGVVRHCLTEELLERALRLCLIGLMKGTIREIKQSTDYFEEGLIKIHGVEKSAPFYTAEEQIQRVPHLSISEAMKTRYTRLQRLIVWTVAIKDMIGEDAELHQMLKSYTADPAIVEFLRLKRGDLTRKALLWAERGRSRSLVQQLPANKSTHGMINMADNLQDEWNKIQNSRLSCGENTVFVEYNFDTAHEYISDFINFNRIVTWIVYVITKDDEVHMLCNEVQSLSHLSDVVGDINRKLSEGERDAYTVKMALMELYGILIEPISDLLRGMDAEDKLVFAADEVLTNVPFSILLDAKTEKYLFQNHTVSFTPSLQILEHCHRRLKLLQESEFKVEPSLALGDPAYLREEKRLKRTYFEVQTISSLFNEGSVKVLTGTEATVDNLLKQSNMAADTVQGFIHVAAHNHVDKNHKAGSLQLAHPSVMHQEPPPENATEVSDINEVQRGGKDAAEVEARKARQKARAELKAKPAVDSKKAKKAAEAEAGKLAYLPSERIMQRESDWRCCVVVLSACNSAKGYVLASEGVVGLPRAFLLAGVPCIVASQWKLEDQSSSELMVEFYRKMSGGTTDAASALRAAMLRMMKGPGSSEQVVDVYKWGGYLVWGLPTVTLSPRVMKQCRNSG